MLKSSLQYTVYSSMVSADQSLHSLGEMQIEVPILVCWHRSSGKHEFEECFVMEIYKRCVCVRGGGYATA